MNNKIQRRKFAEKLLNSGLCLGLLQLMACGTDDSLQRSTFTRQDPLDPNGDAQSDNLEGQSKTPNGDNENLDPSQKENNENLEENKPEEREPIKVVELWNMYAVSLYFEGDEGPYTGDILVEDIIAGVDKEYTFWHGHGGVDHSYTVTAADFAKLKNKEKVTITTDSVGSHTHNLFIDPNEERLRIPGSEIVEVEIYE